MANKECRHGDGGTFVDQWQIRIIPRRGQWPSWRFVEWFESLLVSRVPDILLDVAPPLKP